MADYIRSANRSVFAPALLVIPVLSVALIFGNELPITEIDAFGWVQYGRATSVENKKLKDIRADIPSIDECKKDSVQVALIHPDKISLKSYTGTQQSRTLIFFVFLLTSLMFEALAVMIFFWLALKTVFVIWVTVHRFCNSETFKNTAFFGYPVCPKPKNGAFFEWPTFAVVENRHVL